MTCIDRRRRFRGVGVGLGLLFYVWMGLVYAEKACDDVTEIPRAECEALVELEKLRGYSSFSYGDSPCNVSYVTCEDGHIIEISGTGFKGDLPDLSALNFLQSIDLGCQEEEYYYDDEEEYYDCSSDEYYYEEEGYYYEYSCNYLTSLSDLSTLTNLTFLNLNGNQFSGELDFSLLPSSLQSLDLGYLPEEQGYYYSEDPSEDTDSLTISLSDLRKKFPNLTYIDLSSNLLVNVNNASFPVSLQSLKLRRTGLKQLPDLSYLTNLTTLDIRENKLSEPIIGAYLPSSLTDFPLNGVIVDQPFPDLSALTNLTILNAEYNRLSEPMIGTYLPNSLVELSLNGTLTDQPFPNLSSLTNLTTLDISSNELSEPIIGTYLPSSLTKLTSYNLILNQIFPNLSSLNNLTILELNNAGLKGPVSADYLPKNLTVLSLQGNPLNQSLPDLSSLTDLTSLELADTQLNGSIDTSLLPNSLEKLSLGGNLLKGNIPDFSRLESLYSLSLVNNPQLTGSVKASLFPSSLTSLYLNGTPLGELPNLSSSDNLVYLQLINTQLSGTINATYFPPNLKKLYLSDNQLSGSIDITHFPNSLEYLSLSNNKLSGDVPDFTELSTLRSLDLSFNQLTGTIPTFPDSLETLYLNNNQFSGDVPLSLTDLSCIDYYGSGYYEYLDLGYNHLNTPATSEVSAFLESPGNKDPDWADTQVFSLFNCPGGGSFGITPNPRKLDFGTEVVAQTTTLRLNTRAQDCEMAKISDITFLGLHADEFTASGDPQQNCHSSVQQDHHYTACQFTLSFTPSSEGLKEDTFLEFIFDPEAEEARPVSIKASAVSSGNPQIQINPAEYDFGEYGSHGHLNPWYNATKSQVFTLNNIGNVNLKSLTFALSGDNREVFSFDSWDCSRRQIFPPSTEIGCELIVQFVPHWRRYYGDQNADLVIKSLNNNDVIIPLHAIVKEPPGKCSSAIKSAQSGSWNDPATWTSQSVPTVDDTVCINPHHIIIGVVDLIAVNALYIGADSTLRSQNNQGKPMAIKAKYLGNEGTIEGQDGANETAEAICRGDYQSVIGAPDCAQPGASLIFLVEKEFLNEGVIIAGHGGHGSVYNAHGGNVNIQAETIINDADKDHCGTIKAGNGGIVSDSTVGKQENISSTCIDYTNRRDSVIQDDIDVAETGHAGKGGDLILNASGDIYNKGAVQVLAGDGGNCNPDQTRGGDGGNLTINAFIVRGLADGYFEAGQGSDNCQKNGKAGDIFIDPNVISLAGGSAKIEGGNITIFGGDDWILDLSGLEETQLKTNGDITLAVGEGGIIDLRGNTNTILEAQGQVNILSDDILLEGTAALDQVMKATEVAIGPSRILYNVAWLDANKLVGEPSDTLSVHLTLANNGPTADSYDLTVVDPQGLITSKIPTTTESIEGLKTWPLELTITLPDEWGATHSFTITATSQADENVTATAEIPVVVDEDTITIDLPDTCSPDVSQIDDLCNNYEQTLTDITLGAKAGITGGHLSGQIQGDSTSPTWLKDLTLEPNTQVDNVIIGKEVTWDGTVQWGENVIFQRCGTDRLFEALPILPVLSNHECVQINGGIALTDEGTFAQQSTVSLADVVAVQAQIAVAPQDWYQSADIIVYAAYRPLGAENVDPQYFMLDEQGNVLSWDEQPEHLVTFVSETPLTEVIPITLYQGQFLTTGQLEVYLGYRLPNGDMKVNQQAIMIEINN